MLLRALCQKYHPVSQQAMDNTIYRWINVNVIKLSDKSLIALCFMIMMISFIRKWKFNKVEWIIIFFGKKKTEKPLD